MIEIKQQSSREVEIVFTPQDAEGNPGIPMALLLIAKPAQKDRESYIGLEVDDPTLLWFAKADGTRVGYYSHPRK